jgi:hypothetical protein
MNFIPAETQGSDGRLKSEAAGIVVIVVRASHLHEGVW